MQQFAVSEPSPPADEEQDALRLQVEQIIAQRLERRNLTKGNSATHAATRPARAPTREPIEKPAGEDFDLPPDREADAFEQAFDAAPADARDELDLPESFAPRDALPPLAELETPERRRGERRQAERRNVEFMRTELQWSTSP
ncbi:MAG: hypothetical protein KKB37_08180, partial [Alphaproteobacteria bacterium]|nr:hypothetical protein [Alphaproteobacteria bacterium]